MGDPNEPYDNPPGWTDPYGDLDDLTGDEPLPPLEDPSTPAATPPGSPLLTGLVVALLLVAISVAVFQLLRDGEDEGGGEAAVTTTTLDPDATTTTSEPPETTTTIPLPPNDPYPAVGPQIPVGQMKLMTDRVRVQDANVPDIAFGNAAPESIGSLTASFGEPDQDDGWQVSTGEWGVCVGDFERIVRYGPFAAIVTLDADGNDVFNGYRQDVLFGDLGSPASQLETLSGFRAGNTVGDLEAVYSDLNITFTEDPTQGTIFELTGNDGALILWGPVGGQAETDSVVGIYAPNICDR